MQEQHPLPQMKLIPRNSFFNTRNVEAQRTTLHVLLFYYLDSSKTHWSGKIGSRWLCVSKDSFFKSADLTYMPHGLSSYASYRIQEKDLYFPVVIFKVSLGDPEMFQEVWSHLGQSDSYYL